LAGKSEGNRENFGDPGVDRRKILKLILTAQGVSVWAVLKWLRVGSRVILYITEVPQKWQISCPPQELSLSEEKLAFKKSPSLSSDYFHNT
jgi:hypothetical protein